MQPTTHATRDDTDEYTSDPLPTVGSTLLMGVVFLGILLAVSYPVVALAASLGAASSVVVRRGRCALAAQCPSNARPVR